MKDDIKKLDDTKLTMLRNHFETVKFNSDFDLVYEKQIPNTAIILLSGELLLITRRKKMELKSPGFSLGIKNVLDNIPFHFNCKVKKDSELILIPKSDLIKIMSEKTSPLYSLCHQLVA